MTAIKVTPRPGLFPIIDYPSTGGDDAVSLRAAYNACVAAGGGVIQLENKRGGYSIKSVDPADPSVSSAIYNPGNSGITVDIRGRGTNATIVNLINPVGTLIGHTPVTTQPTVWPISLYDMTFDCASIKQISFQGALYHYKAIATQLNGFNMTGWTRIHRVNVQRLGHSVGIPRGVALFGVNRWGLTGTGSAQDLPTSYIGGVHVKDCDWGFGPGDATSRGGGQQGVGIGGFVNGTSVGTDLCKSAAGFWSVNRTYEKYNNPANVVCQDLLVENLRWTSGRSPVQSSGGPGEPVGTGGDGISRNVTIRDCHFYNSDDVGIELDGVQNCLIENTYIENTDGPGFFLMPYASHSGTHDPDLGDLIIKDCEWVFPDVDIYGSTLANTGTGPSGFTMGTKYGGLFHNRIIWENCHAKVKGPISISDSMFQPGQCREHIMRNCRVTLEPGARTNGTTFNAISINATGQPTTVRIENFRFDTYRAYDTASIADQGVLLRSVGDLDLQINGFHMISSGAQTNSGKRTLHGVVLSAVNSPGEETWALNSIREIEGSCVWIAGQFADYGYDNTHKYVATSNLTTEQKAMYVTSNTLQASDCEVAKTMDSALWVKFVPGTTLTGYKAGTFAKRHPSNDTFVESYVYDDGTNSYLCLDQVIGGVRTTLLPAAGGTATGVNSGGNMVTDTITSPPSGVSAVGLILGQRLATGTAHYESLVIQGNSVIGEHWASAKPGNAGTRPGGTGDAYVTGTIGSVAAADVYKVGSYYWGESGFCHKPISADAYLQNMAHRRLPVLKGNLNDIVLEDFDTGWQLSGLQYLPTWVGQARIDGAITMTNCDFRKAAGGASTVKDYDWTDGTVTTQNFIRRGNKLVATNAADRTITFVSGTAWQNITGHLGTVTIQGGTVTKIELSKDNSTYRDTGVIAGSFRVPPNWYIKLTHTGAPTAAFIAED